MAECHTILQSISQSIIHSDYSVSIDVSNFIYTHKVPVVLSVMQSHIRTIYYAYHGTFSWSYAFSLCFPERLSIIDS